MSDDEREPPPPHDLGAERYVLANMLQYENAIPDVFHVLGEQLDEFNYAFYRPAHWMIYRAILAVWDIGQTPDVPLVVAELTKRKEINRVGGPIAISDLWGLPVVPSNAGKHARIVEDHYQSREVLKLSDRLAKAGRAGAHDMVRKLVDEWVGEQSAETDQPGKSWRPVDLGPILRGERVRPVPSIGLARSDGLRLLYPGKEHTVIGEMESGKSWFCAACCAAELVAGNYVLYLHFEEADPIDTVERLQALGVNDDHIAKRFRFVGPEEPLRPAMLAPLLDPPPTLVVLDGVNEAMALHGQAIREEDGAAAFRRHLVKPFTAIGAATLGADHVVKDRERRDRGPLGSVHKGNAVNGAMILLENAEPFGRGQRGRSHVFITKDRPGHLRGKGRPDSKTPGKTFLGELVVDDTRTQWSYLDLNFWAPAEPQDDASVGTVDIRTEEDDRVLAVVQEVIASGSSPNVTNIRAKSPYGNTKTADALARLVMDGRLIPTDGAKRARLYMPSGSGPQSLQTQISDP